MGESPLDSLSVGLLILLGLVAFANYRAGTLGTWLKAKFFNQHPGSSSSGATTVDPRNLPPVASQTKPANFLTGLGGGMGLFASPIAAGTQPTVTGTFGEARPGSVHEGLDLAVPSGTPIDAARGGVVIYAGAAAGYGNLVTIDHGDGVTSRYGHLSQILTAVGQPVTVGEEIGLAGATGDATGPHLHFEVRQGGQPIDPAPLLGAGASV